MAEFTYQTRRKLSETWVNGLKERGKHLSKQEKEMLPDVYLYAVPQKACAEIRRLLENGTYSSLSELYRKKFPKLVEICVSKEYRDEFYDALDQMNQYQMTAGWYRRSLRSDSYAPFAEASVRLLHAYARLDFYQSDLADILTGTVSPEYYDHARNDYFIYSGMLAARIDRGNEKTIQAVKDILLGEGNTAMISHELIKGIVMSKSMELYELLGKFLLAARLQEGARQAVCETMDAGRPEAFLHLFTVIEENNLIRYSSVKRAVSTWIGIFNENSVDRITEKLLRLMGQCLRNPEFCDAQLATEDSVAISCALWARGFYRAEDAVEAVLDMISHGTHHQKMTASYFVHSLENEKQKMQASKEIILNDPEDLELAACYMPSFMESVNTHFYRLVNNGNRYGGYGAGKDQPVVRPEKMEPEELFDSREEAERSYAALKLILEKLPKKGLTLSPCIFPWHEVKLTKSAAAMRMCLIAWMLQDEALLDEAAALIPLIGQGESVYYYGASRSAAAKVLLYRPVSEKRKAVLFELLHNPEEYTNKEAYRLADDMELTGQDYEKIEKNLKYKKGRKAVLALLQKQEKSSLVSCIERLLSQKSEECRMGGLDLALQLKKEDETQFEKVVPVLRTLTEPTGKEQVLLKELLGEQSEAQDILNTPGYGLYDTEKEWMLPPMEADEGRASGLFHCGENACIRVCKKLDQLIKENSTLSYRTAWGMDELLGNRLECCRYIHGDKEAKPLDAYPFREMWETFYQKEIKTPELLLETEYYLECCRQRSFYEYNEKLYKQVFGSGIIKRPPFQNLLPGLGFFDQVRTVIRFLSEQYVPDSQKAEFALCGMAKYVSVLDTSNDIFPVQEKQWNGEMVTYTKRTAELPVFSDMIGWLGAAVKQNNDSAFTLKFTLQQHYKEQAHREKKRYYYTSDRQNYLELSDYVRCYIRGIWDKDLFYKAVFTFLDLGSLLEPVSAVEQKGAVSSRNARIYALNSFFGYQVIQPVDGKYRFDTMADMPEMVFAHEIYRELIPLVLSVELKRGEQPTPFSEHVHKIQVIYGIDYMIQILTALGKDVLQRGYSYYSSDSDRKSVLSHLLKVCAPKPEETADDLRKALKGTDITKKRLVELAMYANQWIPMIEEYLNISGFASTCYYFMAHTSERFDEQVTSVIAKYTPLSPEELKDGAFDIQWFTEAYGNVGEKEFKLLYDAAKYSSTGTAHARARKYADAALGNVEKEKLKAQIDAKRNKDLLMSLGLLPLPEDKEKREEEMLDRYQFIQKYKKESRQFGAQRRASEGRAAELALRNLSVNAGFTDVTRLTLRMEGKLTEQLEAFFDWTTVDEIEIMVAVDEDGKSALKCRKAGKILKSVPAKYKKNETVVKFQEVNKKLKEQYGRTKQMMEQAMEDRTAFEVWELLELHRNPVAGPIVKPLVVVRAGDAPGFLTDEGIADSSGAVHPVCPDDQILIAHPFDLYQSGEWQAYQKLLFEKQIKQPFKQVFRELYVKLSEELEKENSLLFAGNQIQPQKTVGALRSRRWVADYDDGLQKIYYKENIVARIYAMTDWFTPSDVEAPTLEWVAFLDRKTGKPIKIKDISDVIYSEVMRDVDLAVSVAHAGGVDPETSHSTIEMRKAIVECNLELFRTKNVRLEGNFAVIDGTLGQYSVHLGSGVVHQTGNAMLFVVPVHSQHRGRIFLPFLDDDPKTAEIVSKILLFAEDQKIKDPKILEQIR